MSVSSGLQESTTHHSLQVCHVADHELKLSILGTMLVPDGVNHTAVRMSTADNRVVTCVGETERVSDGVAQMRADRHA